MIVRFSQASASSRPIDSATIRRSGSSPRRTGARQRSPCGTAPRNFPVVSYL